jgi:hypothetical protein
VAWYSFASKIQAAIDDEGKIVFFDFNAGKRLAWEPGSETIYESPIDEDRQFAGGVSGPFQGVNMIFDSLEAEKHWKVTKELGTYEGRSVEVWAARQPESESGPTSVYTVYIDVERRLPVALADASREADGNFQTKTEVKFDYPDSGPTDIYDAGAPKTALIKPAAEQ